MNGRLYRLAGVPDRARMPRSTRINAGPIAGIALILFPWVAAAAAAFL